MFNTVYSSRLEGHLFFRPSNDPKFFPWVYMTNLRHHAKLFQFSINLAFSRVYRWKMVDKWSDVTQLPYNVRNRLNFKWMPSMSLYDQLRHHAKLFEFSTILAFSRVFLVKMADKWLSVTQLAYNVENCSNLTWMSTMGTPVRWKKLGSFHLCEKIDHL